MKVNHKVICGIGEKYSVMRVFIDGCFDQHETKIAEFDNYDDALKEKIELDFRLDDFRRWLNQHDLPS